MDKRNTASQHNMDNPRDDMSEIPQIDCAAVIADLWLLIDGEGAESTRLEIALHVQHCCQCVDKYTAEKALKELINKKCCGPKPPESLVHSIQNLLFEQPGSSLAKDNVDGIET